MSQSNTSPVDLQLNQVRDETLVEENTRKAEELFQAQKPGKCCRNMWRWYFCPKRSDDYSTCFDTDHLTAHFLVITIYGILHLFVKAMQSPVQRDLQQSTSSALNLSHEVWFIVGMVVSIVMAVWGLFQITLKLYGGRMQAAKILDANIQLRKERLNLDNNIVQTINVQQRLSRTQQRKADVTKKLHVLFKNLHKRTHEIDMISDANAKVGSELKDGFYVLLEKLKNELIASEKSIVVTIYNSVSYRDGIAGLGPEEYKDFVAKLPGQYSRRFKFEVGHFDEHAGSDGIFDRKELFAYLDKVIEQEFGNDS